MNQVEAWRVAFDIYRQGSEIPQFNANLKTNPAVRTEILTSLREGILELNSLGEQEIANTGRRLYNAFSGKEEYQLVEPKSAAPTVASRREIIHAYARHGESCGDSLTCVGVLETIGITDKLKEVYAGRKPKIFTSPSNRTYETGEIIGKELGIPVERRRELSLDSTLIKDFVESTLEDAIFVSHAPQLSKLVKRDLAHADYEVVRRKI